MGRIRGVNGDTVTSTEATPDTCASRHRRSSLDLNPSQSAGPLFCPSERGESRRRNDRYGDSR